ncbi:MAG TPA: hypothetical protein VGW96_04985 [Candidatus Eremiobacteraceae bacterium]|nr:hypothetical protein [Candidatus Eremiobacteraceae bacterium]
MLVLFILTLASMMNPMFSPHTMASSITNEFFPLTPGVMFVYTGKEDGKQAREEIQVLSKSTVINGVKVITVRDVVYLDGQLRERADDWYAQDASGNVWYLGEDTKEFENGRVVSTAGSWKAGENGATAGIMMPARPRIGTSYHQEYAPKIAQDEAQVTALNALVTVPYKRFSVTVCTRESSPLEAGSLEHKCYAKGVGLIRSSSDDASTDLQLQAIKK